MRWWIPNSLTVLRLFAAPGVPVMFLYFQRPAADWFALGLFVIASLTDWIDGYLARRWGQESKFGTMLDPIADKAMVVIALVVITGYSGMNPWLILPVTVILFREVFVSGLREYLGSRSGLLAVTKLVLGTGLGYVEDRGLQPAHWSATSATQLGLVLIWLAAALTLWTGIDYFRKALPFLRSEVKS